MKLLTYNISWESVTGQYNTQEKNKKKFMCLNQPFPTKCLANIIENIKNNYGDIMALQEVAKYKYILSKMRISLPHNYKYVHHISRKNNIVTLYNANIIKHHFSYKNEFKIKRPYIISFFNSNNNYFFVINVHFPHYDDFTEDKKKFFYDSLDGIIDNLNKIKNDNSNLENKFINSNFIIMGDFNMIIDFDIKLNIFNKTISFTKSENINTCCDVINGKNFYKQFDNILTSFNNIKYNDIKNIKYPASDHKIFTANIL